MRLISIEGKNFIIQFPYNLGTLEAVRAIPGRKYEPVEKVWQVPISSNAATSLFGLAQQHGFTVSEPALDLIADYLAKSEILLQQSAQSDTDFELSCELGQPLFPYQKAGVQYALTAGRCFIGDEMGLGKTAQALATVEEGKTFPAVVICPASLKVNWRKEIEKWLPARHTAVIANSKTDLAEACRYADFIIINYELLISRRTYKKGKDAFPVVDELRALGVKAVVADESHYIKNKDALRSKAAVALAKGIPTVLCLTGTPVTNRPLELVGQLEFLGRLQDFGGFWNFVTRYCNAFRGPMGWDFSGSSNGIELNNRLREICYIRRLKADVLKELPDKIARTVYFPVDVKKYKKATQEAQDKVTGQVRMFQAEAMVEAMKLAAAEGKIDAVIEWVREFLDSGRKLVLFAWHHAIIDKLREAFPGQHVCITGKTSSTIDAEGKNERERAVEAFQTDNRVRLFIGNIRAAGVGLTLTASSDVAFVEFRYTPGEHEQAEDRVHRIGQKEAVTAWYLVGEGTIDEEIIEVLGLKQTVVREVSEGKFDNDKNRTNMKAILEAIRAEQQAKFEQAEVDAAEEKADSIRAEWETELREESV